MRFQYNDYQDIVNAMEFEKMESFGIRYFIFRRDLEKEYLPIREYWSRNYDLVFKNSLFDVFENVSIILILSLKFLLSTNCFDVTLSLTFNAIISDKS